MIAAVVAKLAALSLPAKATTAGIAVALGATGGVVAHAATAEPVDDGAVVEETSTTTVPEDVSLPEASSFGQSVAEDARDGGVDGQTIAERARQRIAEQVRQRTHEGGVPEDAPAAERVRTRTESRAGDPTLPDQAAEQADQNRAGDAAYGPPDAQGRRP